AGNPVRRDVRMAAIRRASARNALAAGPRVAGVSLRDVRGRRDGAGVAASPRGRSGGAPPVEMAAQWGAGWYAAVRADLRRAVPDGRGAEPRDEPGGALAAADSADLGLRDPAVPPDGRRHHLPGGLRLHPG